MGVSLSCCPVQYGAWYHIWRLRRRGGRRWSVLSPSSSKRFGSTLFLSMSVHCCTRLLQSCVYLNLTDHVGLLLG